MPTSEARKRYQNSDKGRAARVRYMEKRKARLVAKEDVQKEVKTETPIEETVGATEEAKNIDVEFEPVETP